MNPISSFNSRPLFGGEPKSTNKRTNLNAPQPVATKDKDKVSEATKKTEK